MNIVITVISNGVIVHQYVSTKASPGFAAGTSRTRKKPLRYS